MQSASTHVPNVSKSDVTEETFIGVNGVTIFARSWRPPGQPREVVVIAHGFNSHSGQYFRVAEQFLSAGLAVYAMDHRGRGKSGGNSDPLFAGENQAARTISELVRADEQLKTAFPRITLPLLILYGTKDKAAKSDGSEFFHKTAGSKDKTLKLYDGAFHDLSTILARKP